MKVRNSIPILAALLLGVAASAHAAQPQDAAQEPVQKLINILKDPLYMGATEGLQREKAWSVFLEVFDFPEIAKLTLAGHWKRFSLQQRKEFTLLFAKLLGNTYMDKLLAKCRSETFISLGPERISDARARVKTQMQRGHWKIPVDYSLRMHNDAWKIYDVKVAGVSQVKNYRTQFKKFLVQKPPKYLIAHLQRKVARQEKGKIVTALLKFIESL
jgi:phospholipid transport system substrate-binding protein